MCCHRMTTDTVIESTHASDDPAHTMPNQAYRIRKPTAPPTAYLAVRISPKKIKRK